MRLSLIDRRQGGTPFALIFGGMAFLAVVAARITPLVSFLPPCRFKSIFGVPCPTCGAGRAVTAIAHADVLLAVVMNPLCSAVLILALVAFVLGSVSSLLRLQYPNVELSATEQEALRIAVIVLFLANWAFLIIEHR